VSAGKVREPALEERPGRRGERLVPRLVLAAFCSALLLSPRGAPATISEQRARLPPPAQCSDEVEGIWRSHSFWEGHGQWYVMTLEIRRDLSDRNRLVGTILSHYWNGTPEEQEPPPCRPGLHRQVVRMHAEGRIDDGVVAFGGTSWEIQETFCGSRYVSYYPDRFTGRIDPVIQEFQSVNNDGGPAVNVPQVFRRIRCFEPGERPHVTVSPPPIMPGGGGCNCRHGGF